MACPGYPTAALPGAPMTATAHRPLSDAARNELVERVWPLVHAIVRDDRRVPANERDDVIGEAVVAVVKAFGRYDPARAAPTTFASRVVKGAIATWLRNRQTINRPLAHMDRPDDIESGPESDGHRGECDGPDNPDALSAVANLAGITANLTPGQQRLFGLLASGLTMPQVADQLGRKLSIVEIAVRRLVARLVEGGRLPPELVERFAAWKVADAANPARKAVPTRPRRKPKGERAGDAGE